MIKLIEICMYVLCVLFMSSYVRLHKPDICSLIFPKYSSEKNLHLYCKICKVTTNHDIEFISDAISSRAINIFVDCLVYRSYVLTIHFCVPLGFQPKMRSWIPKFNQCSYKHRLLMTRQMLLESSFQVINI